MRAARAEGAAPPPPSPTKEPDHDRSGQRIPPFRSRQPQSGHLFLSSRDDNAVDTARRDGFPPFCLTLDSEADAYAQRIFGAQGVRVVDHVERLPERLPALYAALTG